MMERVWICIINRMLQPGGGASDGRRAMQQGNHCNLHVVDKLLTKTLDVCWAEFCVGVYGAEGALFDFDSLLV